MWHNVHIQILGDACVEEFLHHLTNLLLEPCIDLRGILCSLRLQLLSAFLRLLLSDDSGATSRHFAERC